MLFTIFRDAVLTVATFPFIYYLLVIYSTLRFFRRRGITPGARAKEFTPPVSNLKPVRGIDPGAYENFASYCRQDYPDYELVFCVDGKDDPIVPLLERLRREFPDRQIRILYGTNSTALNDKAAKLARLVSEARHEIVVISDSDVRAQPDYLRTVVAPMADPQVGAVTCLYSSIEENSLVERIQTVGMVSDFYAGLMVAWQLDGVKFALGPTIVTTRARLEAFGGYHSIENRPGDDLLVGRMIAEQGCAVELLPNYIIQTVADYQSFQSLMAKRIRWFVVMRHMRPWGHLGLVFTHGLAWTLAALAVAPRIGLLYGGIYLGLRLMMTWLIGVRGLHDRTVWRKMWLLPVWDALAFFIWVVSFVRNSFNWRGSQYYVRDGHFVAAAAGPATKNH